MSRTTGRRGAVLELAVLGLLHETPMHGYELRKRLNVVLGAFRALSYGTLYPCLRDLVGQGWIAETAPESRLTLGASPAGTRRARIVYELTADGKDQFQALLGQAGPAAWEDETFDVHFAFFGRTAADVRLRILEGRRSRLEDRLEAFRASAARGRERIDAYTAELQRHGLESAEREVRWLSDLIATERSHGPPDATSSPGPADPTGPADPPDPARPEPPDRPAASAAPAP